MRLLVQNTARTIMVLLVSDSDHITGVESATLTIEESKNGLAFASTSPTVNERGNGWYAITLTTTNTNTLGDYALHITASGADPIDVVGQVVAVNVADAVRAGLTALPNANAEAAGGLFTRGTGAGQVNQDANGRLDTRTASMASNVVTAAALATDAVTEIRDAILDYALDTGRTVKGYMRRSYAFWFGKVTGQNGASVVAYKSDNTTPEFTVAQDTAAGSRSSAGAE